MMSLVWRLLCGQLPTVDGGFWPTVHGGVPTVYGGLYGRLCTAVCRLCTAAYGRLCAQWLIWQTVHSGVQPSLQIPADSTMPTAGRRIQQFRLSLSGGSRSDWDKFIFLSGFLTIVFTVCAHLPFETHFLNNNLGLVGLDMIVSMLLLHLVFVSCSSSACPLAYVCC